MNFPSCCPTQTTDYLHQAYIDDEEKDFRADAGEAAIDLYRPHVCRSLHRNSGMETQNLR